MNLPHVQLAMMSRQYVLSRAIHAVAHLNVADFMSEQAISIKELASLTKTQPDLLDRLLNYLTTYGLFIHTDEGYALTPLSMPLRQNDPNSIKDILMMFDTSWWESFAQLEKTVQSGIPAFELEHECVFFDFLNNNRLQSEVFKRGLQRLAYFDDKAIVNAFDFSPFENLIIVGEDKLHLKQLLEQTRPQLKSELHNSANPLPNADAYLLKGLLHDFNDQAILELLKKYRKEMPAQASLIIAEQIMPSTEGPHTNKTMDIVMMVLVGGQQRSLKNWQRLVELAGFQLQQVTETEGVYSLMAFN